jgi:tetratricopeptide (TPR) repeat protein
MKNFLLPIFILIFTTEAAVAASSKLHENFVSYYKTGLRYSLMSIAKEILARDYNNVNGLENALEEVVLTVGSRNFQGFSVEQLGKHKFNFINYVIGRKYFQSGDWDNANQYLRKVSPTSRFYPMAIQAMGALVAQTKQEEKAQLLFDKCARDAKKRADDFSGTIKKQYQFVEYECIIGKARVVYGMRKLPEAEKYYMELSKKSYIWPQILVEEAWNSYSQKAYNRSLGKVATYKAPQLRYAYKPEVDTVRAMSYLEMCLYDDAIETVNSFYKVYEPLAKYLEGTLARYSRDVLYYYNLARAGINQDGPYNDFLQGALKDPDTHLLMQNIIEAKKENEIISSKFRGRAQSVLENTMADYQESQRVLIGRIIRTKFKRFSVDLREALQDMSYIKLEVLGRKKSALYQGKAVSGKRGDVEYLKRTRAQYFWNFKKEFWADELGDYVFALASECHGAAKGEAK